MSNFLNKAQRSAEKAERRSRLDEGYVLSTSKTDDSLSSHSVKLRTANSGQVEAEVLRRSPGDFYLPPPGSIVSVGYFVDGTPVVIDSHDLESDTPSLKGGERRVGHATSYSHLLFEENGTLTIENDHGHSITMDDSHIIVENDDGTTVRLVDGTLEINGGTTPIVTDVETTTDSDGHVTSVNTVTNDSIQI